MASRVIRPVERMLINLSGLASGQVATVYLARRIDVTPYSQVTAYVRLHTGTTISTTPTSSLIGIHADSFTSEDPGALDSNSNPAFQTNLVNTDIKTTGPEACSSFQFRLASVRCSRSACSTPASEVRRSSTS